MKNLSLEFVSKYNNTDLSPLFKTACEAHKTIINGDGAGADFLGWKDLPINDNQHIFNNINSDIERLDNIDTLVVIGIGGSYLGSRAVIESLMPISNNKSKVEVVYAGHNINGLYMNNLLHKLDNREYAVVVISKSGTTTEPAIAFRIIREHLYNKYGSNEAQNRIIAVTDGIKGTLFNIARNNNYSSYVIPDNVGGRYSVLTPVGLVPIAFAGYDIKEMLRGAKDMAEVCSRQVNKFEDIDDNIALKYAIIRNHLYINNYSVEILVSYYDELKYFTEWWKQLFGESEGKDGKGLFPASVNFTTDLHSLGQFIQGGTKNVFETVLHIDNIDKDVIINNTNDNEDNLNYLVGKSLHYINHIAEKATIEAHTKGNVPNIIINVDKINEYNLGQLIYFFEYACAISGYMIGVNPFNQPDVEQYKQNMFRMLGR